MKTFLVPVALVSGLLLSACDSEPSGLLQQRIAELESQCDAARKRADALQARLDAKERETETASSAPAAPATQENKETDETKALVGAAVMSLGESLREQVKPGMLHAYHEAAWAGFRMEKGGEARGVAVPFFHDAGGQWICGWSDSQILAALEGSVPPAVAPPPSAPVAAEVPSTPAPPASNSAPVVRTPPPPTIVIPQPTPTPVQKPTSLPRPGSKSFVVDPATGEVYRVRPDGTREPLPVMR